MSKGINLAVKRTREDSRFTNKRLRTIRYTAIGILVSVGVVSTIIFILIAASPLGELNKERDSLQQELVNSTSDYGKYIVTKSHLKKIEEIKGKRSDFAKTYQILKSIQSQGLIFTGFSIDDDGIEIKVLTQNVLDLESFLDQVYTKSVNKELPLNVVADSISYEASTRSYSTTLSFN